MKLFLLFEVGTQSYPPPKKRHPITFLHGIKMLENKTFKRTCLKKVSLQLIRNAQFVLKTTKTLSSQFSYLQEK